MSKEIFLASSRPPVSDHEWLRTRRVEPNEMWQTLESTGAVAWMGLVRAQRPNGSIDMEQTARNVGVELRYDELPFTCKGMVEGLLLPGDLPIRITLNSIHDQSQPLTFGHELGHIFLTSVLGHAPTGGGKSPEIELFCDYFGHQFIMPDEIIESIGAVDEALIERLMDIHSVDLNTMVIRLMLSGKLPEKIAIDSRLYQSENSAYSGKICRAYACLRCERDEQCEYYGGTIAVLKFLDKDYWGGLGGCIGSEPDYFWDKRLFERLNDQYNQE